MTVITIVNFIKNCFTVAAIQKINRKKLLSKTLKNKFRFTLVRKCFFFFHLSNSPTKCNRIYLTTNSKVILMMLACLVSHFSLLLVLILQHHCNNKQEKKAVVKFYETKKVVVSIYVLVQFYEMH